MIETIDNRSRKIEYLKRLWELNTREICRGNDLIRRPNIPSSRQVHQNAGLRRPFWLPASNYYVLSAAVAIAFFFLVWGILHDEGDETPWITSGVGASIILAGAAILREIILRRARSRHYQQERRLNATFASVSHLGDRRRRGKLTLEQNAAILGSIRQKSNAAKVLNKFSAGHREVFELCSEYIARNEDELKTVGASSPRFGALLKGRTAASAFHRHHLLQWAEIESRLLMNESNSRIDVGDKIKAAKEAVAVIDYALEAYPAEDTLLESKQLLCEMVVSITITDLIEQAERAVFKNDIREAISLYRDALFYLGRDNLNTEGRQQAANRLIVEIEKLRMLERGV